MDGSGLGIGDCAGLCLLIGSYGLIGILRERDGLYLVMKAREPGEKEEKEYARIPLAGEVIRLRAEVDFEGGRDEARFLAETPEGWSAAGPVHRMRFALDHFTGCRFGLFLYSTEKPGGRAAFTRFRYFPGNG